jgi:uncharacterized membrane protein
MLKVYAPPPPPLEATRQRDSSVDALRGAVMLLMALDHGREFLHHDAFFSDPVDATTTTAAVFATRWLTHLCAPTFVALAGVGAGLAIEHGARRGVVARLLLWRGLLLVLLELTWVKLSWEFAVDVRKFTLLVIWTLGVSMIALAFAITLPRRVTVAFAVIMIVLHDATNSVTPASLGPLGSVWRVLHARGHFQVAGVTIEPYYPLLPWVGVMLVGYAAAPVFTRSRSVRRRTLLYAAAASLVGFVLLRGSNLYGDPRPWSHQSAYGRTIMDFLNVAKYPPSLCFLLATGSVALLLFLAVDRAGLAERNPLVVFGRTPLFFYLLHLPALHALGVAANAAKTGRADWLYGSDAEHVRVPGDAGFGLLTVYGAVTLTIAALYPLCRWYARQKAARRWWWTVYV